MVLVMIVSLFLQLKHYGQPLAWLVLLFCCFSKQVLAAPATEAACTLRLALDTPFPPHIVLDDRGVAGQPAGLNVRLLQALASAVGCQVSFVKSPWARSLRLLQQGQLDVLSQLSFNAERSQEIAFIGPHLTERIWLIADPTQVPPVQQLADLAQWPLDKMVALLNGGYFGEPLQLLRTDRLQRRRFYPIVSNQDKLALLKSGRVQAVLEEELAWQYRLQQQPSRYQQLLMVHQAPVYFGFSRASVPPELLKRLAAAWQQLYQQGVLEQVRRDALTNSKVIPVITPLPEPTPYL